VVRDPGWRHHRPAADASGGATDKLDALKGQLEAMQRQIDALASKKRG